MPKNQLLLIDGHAWAYRMFYAMPLHLFTTKAGEPTNATYGFTRALMDWMFKEDAPTHLAVCFDIGRTFRDDIFTDYKGTRAKMPDELVLQMSRIRQIVQAFNIPIFELDGYEADDLLGTIAKQMAGTIPVHIVTGDRDLLQLVDKNTTVELPPTTKIVGARLYDAAAVEAEFEIRPNQIVDWKALQGDSSDNIPGVPGIGAKTSVMLLKQYQTLDNLYAHLNEVAPRWQKKLLDGKESAYLSQKLARIVVDAPVAFDLEACVTHEFNSEQVLDLFLDLEFRTLTEMLVKQFALNHIVQPKPKVALTQTVIVQTEAQLQEIATYLQRVPTISFDVETTGLDRLTAEVVGICLSADSPIGYYIPIGHVTAPGNDGQQRSLFATQSTVAPNQLPLKTVLDALRAPLTAPYIEKVAHNAQFDYMILQRAGLTVTPIRFDTMLAEWICDPSSKHLGLKDLVRHRLGIEMQEITELIGTGKTQRLFSEVTIEEAAKYGSADAELTLRLKPKLEAELKNKQLSQLLQLELDLMPVLADMEWAGIEIDVDHFKKFGVELEHRLQTLEQEIYKVAGRPFNISSTQQLSDILFHELKLPHERFRKTQSGHFSTASDVLESLRDVDTVGIIVLLLEHRELAKLKNTYVDALPEMINPTTGRVHTSFKQTGAVTGRLASVSPNLQNIPIRTEIGRQVRRGFVAKKGHYFVSADYSQIELRILAHVSQDEALLAAFQQDQDIHRTTAATVYGISAEKVTFEQRRFAKAVNFGLMYGMGAYRLARDSELTLAEADNFIKTYFERFPGVRRYLDGTKELAHQRGYVETLLGRRRYFPIFTTESTQKGQAVARAEREAINHPIQGTAADIIKLAMIRLHEQLKPYKAKLLLQIHDELILEVPEDEVETIRPMLVETMSNAFKLSVPIKVDVGFGRNWYELKE